MLRTLLTVGMALALMQLVPALVPAGLHAIAWVAVAVMMFAIGFSIRVAAYRWAGFGVLALAAGRLLLVELAHISAVQRILTFVVGGLLLLVVSFVYARFAANKT